MVQNEGPVLALRLAQDSLPTKVLRHSKEVSKKRRSIGQEGALFRRDLGVVGDQPFLVQIFEQRQQRGQVLCWRGRRGKG